MNEQLHLPPGTVTVIFEAGVISHGPWRQQLARPRRLCQKRRWDWNSVCPAVSRCVPLSRSPCWGGGSGSRRSPSSWCTPRFSRRTSACPCPPTPVWPVRVPCLLIERRRWTIVNSTSAAAQPRSLMDSESGRRATASLSVHSFYCSQSVPADQWATGFTLSDTWTWRELDLLLCFHFSNEMA